MLRALTPRLGVTSGVRHCSSSRPSGAFVIYRYQSAAYGGHLIPIQTLLRAVDPAWVTATNMDSVHVTTIETRRTRRQAWDVLSAVQNFFTPVGGGVTFRLPEAVPPGVDGEYKDTKLVPGVLAGFRYKVNNIVMPNISGVIVSLGASDECTIRPILLSEYIDGQPADKQPRICVEQGPLMYLPEGDLTVPLADVHTGYPEISVNRATPLVAYALLAHPQAAQKSEVLVDGELAYHDAGTKDLWQAVFSPRSCADEKLGEAATNLGLVRSRAEFLLDDEKVPILIPSEQADGEPF